MKMFLMEHASIYFQDFGDNSLYLVQESIIHSRMLIKGSMWKERKFSGMMVLLLI